MTVAHQNCSRIVHLVPALPALLICTCDNLLGNEECIGTACCCVPTQSPLASVLAYKHSVHLTSNTAAVTAAAAA